MKNLKSSVLLIILISLSSLLFIFSCKKDNKKIELEEIEVEEVAPCLAEIDGTFQEVTLDIYPEYLDGGDDGFSSNFAGTISYPFEARENGIEGFTSVTYEITEEGEVENVEIIENPGGGIGEELKSVIEEITTGISFSPGVLNGSPIRIKKTISSNFKLQG